MIHSLHARIVQSPDPHTVYLLPAHEHLTSSLREIHVPDVPAGHSIHTGFAWLGHGSITHRADVTDFLALAHALNLSDSEMKMADNYFAILKNRVPEIWFDQGIELAGGQPFTVGVEGDERNNRHIVSGDNRKLSSSLVLMMWLSVGTSHGVSSVHRFERKSFGGTAILRSCAR